VKNNATQRTNNNKGKVKNKCKTKKQKKKHNVEKQKKHNLIRQKNFLVLYPSHVVFSLSGGTTFNPKTSNPKPNSNLPIFPPEP